MRVLNLWQKNNVFSIETIQPLLDMANPNANLGSVKFETSPIREASGKDNLMLNLQMIASQLGLNKSGVNANAASSSGLSNDVTSQQNTIRFNKKLLDFDYGDDDEDEKGETPTEAEPPLGNSSRHLNNDDENPLALSVAQNLLSNPELLQRLQQQMQQSLQHQHQAPSDLLKGALPQPNATDLQHNFNSNDSVNSSNANFVSSFQTINSDHNQSVIQPNELGSFLVDNSNVDGKANNSDNYPFSQSQAVYMNSQSNLMRGDNAGNFSSFMHSSAHDAYKYSSQGPHSHYDQMTNDGLNDGALVRRSRSRSRSPRRSRFGRSGYRERSRSRSPRRDRHGNIRDDRRFRTSPSRSPRSRYDHRGQQPPLLPPRARSPNDRDKERERRRRGLPVIRKGYLTMCSTTLWLGHVPKLVSEADLSDAFGEFGSITSIDVGVEEKLSIRFIRSFLRNINLCSRKIVIVFCQLYYLVISVCINIVDSAKRMCLRVHGQKTRCLQSIATT